MPTDDIQPAGNSSEDRNDTVRRALVALRESRARVTELERMRSEPIAIVGLACRLPGGDDPDALWSLLDEGRCAIGDIPPDRWDVDAWYDPDPDAPGRMYTRQGAFLDGIDRFDAELFGVNPHEAAAMDPQHRLLLETAWRALEDAGISPHDCLGTPTGVFVGISYSDYGRLLDRAGATDPYVLPGTSLNAAAGRISYTLGLRGPSVAVDTACSSSAVAVHQAIHALRLGECDLALAGGVNAILTPEMYVLACKARMLSPSGLCRTFDEAADGFVRGEGCGFVALRRLSDARVRGERVLALIRASAVNQDGRTSGLTAPSGTAQAEVIRMAIAQAGLEPADIDFIEAHGTGTKLGDPIEMGALGSVFTAPARAAPLLVGSVKTNLGHLESAAGITGLIKVVLSLVKQRIPPHLHLSAPSPHIPWSELPIRVPTQAESWVQNGERPRRAGVSSFGFSGTNAHIVVEEAPAPNAIDIDHGRDRLLVVSARTPGHLRDQAERWAARLDDDSVSAADACRVAASGRARFKERLVVVGGDSATVAAALRQWPGGGTIASGTRLDDPGGIAFLCSGQGSQRVGMGQDLYRTHPTARAVFDRAAAVLDGVLERPLLSVMFEDDHALTETAHAQPALYVLSVALAAVWREWGVEPIAVLGHSVGEYAAAHLAGVFGFEDGLRLVAARGRLMQKLDERGTMAAVQASANIVETALREHAGADASLACRNGPLSQVVSGRADVVERVVEALRRNGHKATALRVSHAFHSVLMEPMLDAFGDILRKTPMAPPSIPLASNADGAVAGRTMAEPAYWIGHTRNTVCFEDGMATLRRLGCNTFVELGPAATLIGLAQGCTADSDQPTRFIPSLSRNLADDASLRKAAAELFVAGHEPDWDKINGSGRIVSLPGCTFERKRYWLPTTAFGPRSDNTVADGGPAFYRVAWNPTRLVPSIATSGRWIVAEAGDSSFCRDLADALAHRGAEVRRVPADELDQEAMQNTVGVVFAGAAVDDPDTTEQMLLEVLLGLAQQVIAASGPRLWIVTEGAETTDRDGDAPQPGASALSGFGKVVGLEGADAWGGTVDRSAGTSAEAVVDAVLADDGEDRIALRGDERLVARLDKTALPPLSAPVKLRGDGVYLVTGGTGALGVRMLDWLVERGARDIAVISRRGISDAAAAAVERLTERGVRIRMVPCDLANTAAVRTMIGDVAEPIRGVVHAAGTVSQVNIEAETPDGMGAVLAGKVRGAWALHEATRDADLDHFILFSSIAALWGSKGQGAYAAANRYLDGLADHRRADGLPALSVNWGPWADGGMADTDEAAWLQSSGLRLIAPDRALAALDQALAAGVSRIGVADVDWSTFAPLYAHRGGGRLFNDMAVGDADASVEPQGPSALAAELAELAPRRRVRHLGDFIREQVADLLGTAADGVPGDQGFFEIGMDSFLQVELRGRLASALGIALPPTVALEHHTAEMLARHILTDGLDLACGVGSKTKADAPVPAADPVDIRDLDENELMALIEGDSPGPDDPDERGPS